MPPMFEIAEGDLPFVRTRQALIVLDLQNDLVTKDCILPVGNPPNLIENTVNLASRFRDSGDVIWFRSQFITSRVINDKTNLDSEFVITDDELPHGHRSGSRGKDISIKSRPSSKLLEQRLAKKAAEAIANDSEQEEDNEEEEEEEDHPSLKDGEQEPEETFLTAGPGQRSRLVLPESPGANLVLAVIKSLDNSRDLIFQKSHYSAFKDGHLIQTLRGRFVTEIFICGALTNISVFATAMEAARHGLAITLVEDCLGYRSKARHDEALRKLTEYTGCDVMTSADLIKDIQHKEKARARAKERKPVSRRDVRPGKGRKNDNAALEQMMRKLQLDGSSAKNPEPVKSETALLRLLTPQPSRPSASAPAMLSHPIAAGSPGSARDSFDDESTQEMVLPPRSEPQKRERVKAKIKSRRRPSNPPRPTVKQDGVDGEQSGLKPTSNSPIATTVQGASEALAKMSLNSQVPKPSTTDATEVSADANVQNVPTTESDGRVVIAAGEPSDQMERQPSVEEVALPLCEGDTTIINELLSGELAEGVFEKVRDEVRWQRMSHQGGEVPRLVSVQGEIAEDGSKPIYRHPADESPPLLPFSPTVSEIRKQVEEKLGHSVNHVLIQFYRDGTDYISEHSDKTLDIVPETFIANISLGAQRTMVFRTKKPLKSNEGDAEPTPRKSCRAPLPHNSLCKMGLVTNMRWLHGIRQDKRMKSEKSEDELAYGGERISLTFRMIGTFLDKDQTNIWGQGAVAKAKESANTVINGRTPEAEEMIKAFGLENHSSEFDWKTSYGVGFDVLHISNSRKLFLSGNLITDTRVKFMLAELGFDWAEGNLSPAFNWKDGNNHQDVPAIPEQLPVSFVDNDFGRSTVEGDLAILLYLNTVYGTKFTNSTPTSQARILTRFFAVATLLEKWHAKPFIVKPFRHELSVWDTWSAESEFIAGDSISIADFALWPLLDEISQLWRNRQGLDSIYAYYQRLKKLPSLEKALGGRANSRPLAKPGITRRESAQKIKQVGNEENAAPGAAIERG